MISNQLIISDVMNNALIITDLISTQLVMTQIISTTIRGWAGDSNLLRAIWGTLRNFLRSVIMLFLLILFLRNLVDQQKRFDMLLKMIILEKKQVSFIACYSNFVFI